MTQSGPTRPNRPKLNYEWAECIREMVQAGVSQQSIADQLGVSRAKINRVVNRKAYGEDRERGSLHRKIDRLERELIEAQKQLSELKKFRAKQRNKFPLRSATGDKVPVRLPYGNPLHGVVGDTG